ncbi:MAG: NUDIX domain-containing protein [Candidatus Paceibacterota bacterium]
MDVQVKMKPGVGFGVMVFKGGKVLLGKRHEDPEKASSLLHGEGTWTMPGGKLHFHEGLKEAAAREALEETSLIVRNLEVISLSNDIVHDNHFVTVGFFCDDFEGEAKVIEPDEIIKWEWFDLNNLPSPLFPPSAKIIRNYLDKKVYRDN